jgi:hypothetical protein
VPQKADEEFFLTVKIFPGRRFEARIESIVRPLNLFQGTTQCGGTNSEAIMKVIESVEWISSEWLNFQGRPSQSRSSKLLRNKKRCYENLNAFL